MPISMRVISYADMQSLPKSSWNFLQNREVKWTYMLEIIETGTPCRETTSLTYTSKCFSVEELSWTVMKWALLVNLSKITRIVSIPRGIFGSLVMKSVIICSHFYIRISRGCSLPWGIWCLALTFRQVKHLSLYHATSLFIHDHQ